MTASVAAGSGPGERDWAAAVALLSGAEEVVLACHVGPDGDALGSMLGFGAALRATASSSSSRPVVSGTTSAMKVNDGV